MAYYGRPIQVAIQRYENSSNGFLLLIYIVQDDDEAFWGGEEKVLTDMLAILKSQSAHNDPQFRKTWSNKLTSIRSFRDTIHEAMNARKSRPTWATNSVTTWGFHFDSSGS